MTKALDDALLDAHAREDKPALVELYISAAAEAPTDDAAGFYLTHAYVFALDCGDDRSAELRDRLVAMGRETNE